MQSPAQESAATDRLAELVTQWDAARHHGQAVTSAELCQDCPELQDELDRRLGALMRLAQSDTAEPRDLANTRVLQASPEVAPGNAADAGFSVADRPTDVPGFILEQELARGGMGVVYQARDLALKRTVAVKLLRQPAAPDSMIALRFLEEAQITGQLQHPGIPPIYHVGALPSGSPFLAMKLIKGDTLDAKIRRGDRLNYLALIEAIAQAVGYAHAHGVIHRDLKPANIMVGSFGEVQVMDWGLAKVLSRNDEEDKPAATAPAPVVTAMLDPRSDSGGSETQAGSVLGTPAFMAPEQAAGEVRKVDERSDVFGLGAVLCTMLTGKPPYSGSDAHSVLVSASRGRTGDAFARLDQCGAEREVISLCKRCLAFERAERPANGNAVAQEVSALRALAQDQALQAEIDRARQEVARQEQQKRRFVWAGLAAVMVAGLITSSLFSFWANAARQDEERVRIQAQSERDAKELQRQRAEASEKVAQAKEEQAHLAQRQAEQEKAVALAVRTFLQDQVLRQANPWQQNLAGPGEVNQPRHDVTLRELLDKAAHEFSPEAIAKKFPTQPIVQAEVLETIAEAYTGLNEFKTALSFLQAAGSLRESHLGTEHPSCLANTIDLVFLNLCAEQHAAAIRHAMLALKRIEQLLNAPRPTDPNVTDPAAAAFDAALGRIEQRMDPRRYALPAIDGLGAAGMLMVFGQALPRLQRMAEVCAQRFGFEDRRSGLVRLIMGFAYHANNDREKACAIYEEVLQLMERVMPVDDWPKQGMREVLAVTYLSLAIKYPEQVRQVTLSLETSHRVLGPDHPRSLTTLNLLGVVHASGGYPELAVPIFQEVFERKQRLLGKTHPKVRSALRSLAASYEVAEQWEKARIAYAELLDAQTESLGANHVQTLQTRAELAQALLHLGNVDSALRLLEPALQAVKERQYRTPCAGAVVDQTCRAYEAVGRAADAEMLRRQWLEETKKRTGSAHAEFAEELAYLGQQLMRQKRWAEAEAVLREALVIREQREPNEWTTFWTASLIGATLLAQDRPAEAATLLGKAHDGLTTQLARTTNPILQRHQRRRLRETVQRLIEAHQALQQPAAVEKWREELSKVSPEPTR